MKILVPLKRVADPDNANKVKATGAKVETTGLEWKPNPFDEYAVETALRLSPRDLSQLPWWQLYMCALQMDLARYEQAIP